MSAENPIELTNVDVEPVKAVSLPRRKAPIILAAVMAVSLVTAIGVVAGIRLLSAAGDPAEHMPASVAVYATADLTPTGEQVRKLAKFTNPQASVDKLLAEMNAQQDLNGWVGPRVAVGVWLDKNEQLFVLVGLDSKNDDAATKGLTNIKSKDNIGFVVGGGRVLIAAAGDKVTDNQAAAEAAWAEAAKTPLAKNARFADARKWLADEQFAVFYVDLTAMSRVMNKMMEKVTKQVGGEAPTADLGTTEPSKMELSGSLIAGLRVEDDGYLVRYRNIGGNSGKAQDGVIADALARLGALPSASDVAMVAHLSGESATPLSMLPLLFGGFGGFSNFDASPVKVLEPDPTEQPLTEAEFKELDALITKPQSKLSAAEKKRLDELKAKLMGGDPFDQPGDITGPGDLFSEVANSIKDATIGIAITGIADTPAYRALIELGSEPDADLKARLQSGSSRDVKVELAGKTVTITSATFPAGGAKLADDAAFKRTLAGCPAAAQVALYANGAKILPASLRDNVGQIRAIGLCQSVESGESTGSIRVLMG